MDLLAIRFWLFTILALCWLSLGVRHSRAQVVSAADQVLNETEANLLELVEKVKANALNSCGSLSTCNSPWTCTRLSCPVMNGSNTDGDICKPVNRIPGVQCENNCTDRYFDFSRSFVRVPGVSDNANGITPQQLQGICAHNNLDESFFPKLSNATNFYARPFFGLVDGVFRIFPGAVDELCGIYDARMRLWYLTSLAVKKAVTVLIDRSSTMGDTLRSTSSASNLASAYDMTKSFLNTTTKDDYVSIFTFYQGTVEPFSPQPAIVTNSSTHPDFGNFTGKLSISARGPVPPGRTPSNASQAVNQAITSTAGLGYAEIPSDYLKVIILITDSTAVKAIADAPLPWDLIRNNSVSLFLYMFPSSDAAIDGSALGKQLCGAQGYFGAMDDSAYRNPLLAMKAYYSFLANIHVRSMTSAVDYSTEYLDFSGVDNRTFAVSKAVLTDNGELLGVAAINIFKTKLAALGIDGEAIENAVNSRANPSIMNFNASANISSCPIQTTNLTCNASVQGSIVRGNIVCASNFDVDDSTIQKLSCCPTCSGREDPSNLALILGLSLGIPAGLFVIGVFLCWKFWDWISPHLPRCCCRQPPLENPSFGGYPIAGEFGDPGKVSQNEPKKRVEKEPKNGVEKEPEKGVEKGVEIEPEKGVEKEPRTEPSSAS